MSDRFFLQALSYSDYIREVIAWKIQNVIYIYNFQMIFVFSYIYVINKIWCY